VSQSVHDRAHQLARAVKESSEYREYREALDRLRSNETAWKMLTGFRRRWIEFEAARLSGQEVAAGRRDELEEQRRSLLMHTGIAAFLNAEARLGTILEDIQRILAQSLDMDLELDTGSTE